MPLKETTAQRKLIHSKQVADGKLEWLCIRCNKEHPKESFLTKRKGYRMKCNICAEKEAAANAKYRATHIEKVATNSRHYEEQRKLKRKEIIDRHNKMVTEGTNTLVCTKCKEEQPIESFRNHTRCITKHCYKCRQYQNIIESSRPADTRIRKIRTKTRTKHHYSCHKYCSYRRIDISKGFYKSKEDFERLLPREFAYSLMKTSCVYCNYSKESHIGLDRIDPTKPHSVDNVLPCCETCNVAKNMMSLRKFIEHIKDMERTTRPLRLTPLGNMECPF